MTDFALRMLPETFTMYELRRVYELFLGETLDRAQLQKEDASRSTKSKRRAKNASLFRHRPARLYRVKAPSTAKLKRN